MNIVSYDFETYYCSAAVARRRGAEPFTLSSMTCEEYVNDPRFEVLCCSFTTDGRKKHIIQGDAEVGAFLRKLVDTVPDLCLVAANGNEFDHFIVTQHYGITDVPMFGDPQALARHAGIQNKLGGVSVAKLSAWLRSLGYPIPPKGTEVVMADGKRREDFTSDEWAAYLRYCGDDSVICYWAYMHLMERLPEAATLDSDLVASCFVRPRIKLDAATLQEWRQQIDEQRRQAATSVFAVVAAADPSVAAMAAPTSDDDVFAQVVSLTRSDELFAKVLRAVGVVPPTKTSAKRKGTDGSPLEVYAFAKKDVAWTALVDEYEDDPIVSPLLVARGDLKTSGAVTRVERYIEIEKRTEQPVPLRNWGAHTGRLAAFGKINPQNDGRNSLIHKARRARDGWYIGERDASQIEARLNVFDAGQNDIVRLYATGGDVYCDQATQTFGREITKADKVERFVGKTQVLGLGYGMGPNKYIDTIYVDSGRLLGSPIVLDEPTGKVHVYAYRNKNFKVCENWSNRQMALTEALAGGSMQVGTCGVTFVPKLPNVDCPGILLPTGDYIPYFNLRYDDDGGLIFDKARGRSYEIKRLWGGSITENVMQALAACHIRRIWRSATLRWRAMWQTTKFAKADWVQYPIIGQVHDALLWSVPIPVAALFDELLEDEFATAPDWAPGLPLASEGDYGHNMAVMHTRQQWAALA